MIKVIDVTRKEIGEEGDSSSKTEARSANGRETEAGLTH